MLPVPRRRHRLPAVLTLAALTGVALGPAQAGEPDPAFHRLATYPVYLNAPDPAAPTVAEISAVSEDGRTFIHTDALARRIGFVDITDPSHPQGLGTLDLQSDLGVGEHAEPTSVAVVGGHVLVVVDTSTSFTDPSGVLAVVDLATHTLVRTLDLGGQPDSIALTPDKAHAAIAIENQRDEEATPEGADEGDLPQLPGGFLQLVDLPGTDPAAWTTRAVPFPAETLAGLETPQDPEPEYVAVDPTGSTVAVTLQENNGIALVDIASGTLTGVFTAGTASVTGIDVKKDGVIAQTGSIGATPREPDAIAWLDATHVATANEGDWKGGTRGWTVFDATTGTVVWDAGAELERLAVRTGLHNEDRAAKKGVEIEGLAVATMGGTRYAFVGSERSNFVAVYDVDDAAHPVFVQVLATTNGPEGILPVPSRDLLLVSSETDDASVNVRSSVTVFGRGAVDGAGFPTVVSADDAAGNPIGWGALGALTADLSDRDRLWTTTDAAYATTRLLSLDVSRTPAVIDREVPVTQDGVVVGLDVEGLASRPAGGFWLGVEGATGDGNRLVRTDASGAVVETIALPADVTAGLTTWGIEGVTTLTDTAGEHVWIALQRGLGADGSNARIGRYDVATSTWSWFTYPLEATSVAGDWLGLSEITAVDADTLAVIERDKLNGPNALVKRIYTVQIPSSGSVLAKTLAHDVLPDLRATNGWTQEKLEGLTVGGDGVVYAITDNDGLKDATGETVLLRLGAATAMFGATTPTPTPSVTPTPTVTPAPAPTPTPVTVDDLTPATRGGITITGTLRPGGTFTAQASGFGPGEQVQASLFSVRTDLGSARADATGTVTATFTVPTTTTVGTHRLALVGQAAGRTLWTEVQVLAVQGAATQRGGSLAATGVDHVGLTVLAGLVLLGAGTVAVLVRRRRPA